MSGEARAGETLVRLLAERAAATPAAPALIYGGRETGFAALESESRRVAQGLADLGVGPGDRVALWLPNVPAYVVLCLALARLGAIAVAVNTRFRSHEVGDIVGRSGARVLALWPGFRHIDFLGILAEVDPAALAGLEALVLYDEDRPAAAAPAAVAHCRRVGYAALAERPALQHDASGGDAGCNIFTTSGTTRAPKFVLHTQFSIARHAREVAAGFGYAASDGAVLQALPFCGVFGYAQAMAALAAGRPMVLMSAFDAAEAVALSDRHRVRHMNATDDMVNAMLDADPRERALPLLDFAGFGSFNTDPLLTIRRAEARGVTLVGIYGMSELQALYARQPKDAPLEKRALGGGRPVSATGRCRVRDPESGRLLGPGGQGELELAGSSAFHAYFGNPEATAGTITPDGFVRTGDLGYLDGEGGFVFVGRMGDVLRLGGFLVSPVEIEVYLQAHPAVAAAQVVGVRTDAGTRPVAFVVAEAGAGFDETALQAHCARGLAKFKVPVRIAALDAFPTTKSANGTKIQRARLREMAAALLA